MKILVYGAGVIGCYLAHVLCGAGNDVALLARGRWREVLEQDGLTIVHHLQKRTTHDRPQIVGTADGTYDLVFAVMQYQQMGGVLEDLAQIHCPLVVLVGNNESAAEMEQTIQARSISPKTVLFGFQGTGGRREDGRVACIRFGEGSMSIGGASGEAPDSAKETIASAFRRTRYRLTWVRDMDAWYRCHAAFILPVCYLSYALDCDLTRASGRQIEQVLSASREGYGLLSSLGYPILPEGTLEKLEGIRGRLNCVMLCVMAKTAIGRLAATDHCRHAVTEMEALDRAFTGLKARKPDLPMPEWDALRAAMPGWDALAGRYGI